MKFKSVNRFFIFILCLALLGCSGDSGEQTASRTPDANTTPADVPADKTYEKLPDGIKWLTNETDPVFSSPKAKKGGVLHLPLLNFPMTFRVVGPDSNGSFRSAILNNQLSLIGIHPNTDNIIPELATHWAFDDDKKTMYFKLDREARWSDGKPVTAWDYVYTLEFMRSEKIIAPWYNDYYTKEIEKVIVYDDYTIGVRSTKAAPDLHLKIGIGPIPKHFFHPLDETFVAQYNWKIVPNTGAYQISEFKKGKFIKFKRKKDWWARDKKYIKNRFNVDYVMFEVIRDFNLSWEYFKKARIDVFGLTLPKYWHGKSKTDVFEKGYVHKIWFFNDQEQSAQGMWLNQDTQLFGDRQVCYAFAHAMNIEKVISQVLRNDYFRLPQAFFGYGEYTNPDIEPRKFSINAVTRIMEGAGWQRGSDGIWKKGNLRFSANVTYYLDEHTPRLVVLKEEAQRAGVELILERLDPTAAYKKVIEKKHDVAWMGWSTNIRPSYWQGWHSDNAGKPQTNNITNTSDPKLDKLIETYRNSLDAKERAALSRQIQVLIHETGAFVPTFMVPYVRLGYWRWMQLPDFQGTKRSDDLFDPFSSVTGGLFWIDADIRNETIDAMKSGQTFDPVVIRNETYKVEY